MASMYSRMRQAARRAERKAYCTEARRCFRCMTPLHEGERTYCEPCQERRLGMRRARREYNERDMGLCHDCGARKAEPGKSRCTFCSDKRAAGQKQRKDESRRALILDVLVKAGQPVGSEALRQRTKLRRKTLSRVLAVLVAEGSVQLHDPVAYSFLEEHA